MIEWVPAVARAMLLPINAVTMTAQINLMVLVRLLFFGG